MKPYTTVIIMLLGIMISCSGDQSGNALISWKTEFNRNLDMFGHRNWILVVDKAFPEQSSPGMTYFYVEEDLYRVLGYVLMEIENSSHVSPVIFRDAELEFIPENEAEGITAFREESRKILAGHEVNTMLHDEVFKMLDESSELFRVMVIKTNCNLPYTSVFIRLDCAYWNSEQEQNLRTVMSHYNP